jgi:hypothetical protein
MIPDIRLTEIGVGLGGVRLHAREVDSRAAVALIILELNAVDGIGAQAAGYRQRQQMAARMIAGTEILVELNCIAGSPIECAGVGVEATRRAYWPTNSSPKARSYIRRRRLSLLL